MTSPSSPAAPAPSGRELIRDRSVLTYLLAATASTVGTTLQAAALGKQIYDITDSELALGLLGLVEFLPALLLLPLTGSAADRFDRRRVAAIALSAEVVASVLFALYALHDPTSALPLFGIAALFGTARAFAAPSFRSLPPLIAPPGGLPRLIALYSGTWQFGLIVGPAASGFLYDVGPSVPYVVSAGCFGTAAMVVLDARRAPAPGPHADRRAAEPAPRAGGAALHPPPTGAARRHRPRHVRRAVRRRRRPAAGDRRGPPRRRQHRLRLAAGRARASAPSPSPRC